MSDPNRPEEPTQPPAGDQPTTSWTPPDAAPPPPAGPPPGEPPSPYSTGSGPLLSATPSAAGGWTQPVQPSAGGREVAPGSGLFRHGRTVRRLRNGLVPARLGGECDHCDDRVGLRVHAKGW